MIPRPSEELTEGESEHDGGWGPLTIRDIRVLIEEIPDGQAGEHWSIDAVLAQMGLVVPEHPPFTT